MVEPSDVADSDEKLDRMRRGNEAIYHEVKDLQRVWLKHDRERQAETKKFDQQMAVFSAQASQERELAQAEDDLQFRLSTLHAEKAAREAIQACFYGCGCDPEAFGWEVLDIQHAWTWHA